MKHDRNRQNGWDSQFKARRGGLERRRRHRSRPVLEYLESRHLLTSITEVTTPEPPAPLMRTQPQEIVAGPDGNLWFTELQGNRVAMISPDNPTSQGITAFPLGPTTGNTHPWGITVGPDHNIWFAEFNSAIGRITTDSSHAYTQFSQGLPSGSKPVGITAGVDSSGSQVLWFTDAKTGELGMLDPNNNDSITEIALSSSLIGFKGFGSQITAGPGGTLWFTEAAVVSGAGGSTITAAGIGVYTPKTGLFSQVTLPSGNGIQEPTGVTLGPDDNIWFSAVVIVAGSYSGVIGVVKPDPANPALSTEIFTGSTSAPNGISSGPDGDIWYADGFGKIGMVEVNPMHPTHDTLGTPISIPTTVNSQPLPAYIAPGPDGNLWFTDSRDAVGVVRLDKKLVVATPANVKVGSPFGLTVTDEYVDTGAPVAVAGGTVTMSIASGPAGSLLGGTLTVPLAGGVATFSVASGSGLTLTPAGTYTLMATVSSVKPGINGLSATTDPFDAVGVAKRDTKLVVATPANVTAGSPFGLTVTDEYVDTGAPVAVASGTVTLSISTGPAGSSLKGTLTVPLAGGVATFSVASGSGLTLTTAGTYTLKATVSSVKPEINGLSATTNPFAVAKTVTRPTPKIIGESVILTRKTKSGKPVGKATLSGFMLKFSTAMDPGPTGNTRDYVVRKAVTTLVKKKKVTVFQPVTFRAVYNSAKDSVQLLLIGTQTFPMGGQITVSASPPGGVKSALGVFLAAPTIFTILPNASRIVPRG
jgi:virginiamycin B lyase